ncbi:unnamed protein product [Closterium sp. NIES-65]|nr:unnamed protein product [Closterium sp. NIES-65]
MSHRSTFPTLHLSPHSHSQPLLCLPTSPAPTFPWHHSRLDHNQLTGELPSFHHMARLTSQRGLSADHNYLTSTADPLSFNATSQEDPLYYHSVCWFEHNCLGNDNNNTLSSNCWQNQRRASECRAFCGAQPLTPPCSGHGVCSFEPDPSKLPSVEPEGQCVCDEGYTPGTKPGTCVSHGTNPSSEPPDTAAMGVALAAPSHPLNQASMPFTLSFHNSPSEPPSTAVVGVIVSSHQAPRNLLLLLPLAVLLLLAFSLPQFLRRLKSRPPTRYFFSKRALAAQQAAMGVEITC